MNFTEKYLPAETKEDREKLRGKLLAFGKFIMPQAFWASPSTAHYDVERIAMDTSIKKANMILPRGLAKSTLMAENYPMYHLLYEEIGQPKLIVLLSKTQAHSVDRLQAICDTFEYSQNFRALYGYWGKHSAKQWRNNDVILKDGSRIVARGTGQPIRGIKEGFVRPTLIVGDDLEDENNTKTKEAMVANLNWLLQGADYALDTRFGRMMTIGTPIHQLCIVEKLEVSADWHSIRRKYLNTDDEGNLYSLWEEVKTVEELLKEKKDKEEDGRQRIWYMERQCELVGEDDQLFKEEDFRYWNGNLEVQGEQAFINIQSLNKVEFSQPVKKPVNLFMGIDPASSTKQTADFSTVLTIAYDEEKNIYVLPYFRKRVTPHTLAEEIIKRVKSAPITKVGIETTGYQEMLRETLKMRIEEEGIYIAGLNRTDGFKPRVEKNARLEALQPFFARHKVHIQPQMKDLIDELLMYPRGKHDDLLDGLYYATKKMRVPVHEVENEEDELKYFLMNRNTDGRTWMSN